MIGRVAIAFFILCSVQIHGQTWNHIFGDIEAGPPYDTDICDFIVRTEDGLSILYQNSDSISGYWSQVYMRIDNDGNELFRKEYEIPLEHWYSGWWSSSQELSSGDLIQPGYTTYYNGLLGGEGVNPVLTKYNEGGDTLWRKVYPRERWGSGEKVIECENGDLMIVGRTEHDTIDGNPQALLMRCAPDGELLWEKAYGDTVDIGEYTASIVEIPDNGGFFLSGNWRIHPNWDALLMKVDAEGNELWTEHFGHPTATESAHVLGKSSDGNYYLAGSLGLSGDQFNSDRKARLRKFDVDGNTIWEALTGDFPVNEQNYFTAVKETLDGNVACVGILWNDTLGKMGAIAKFDSQTGDSLWLHTYRYATDGYSNHEIFDFTLLEDGGYAMAGHVWQSPENPFVTDDVWVVKVDEYGCLEPGCQLTGLSDIALDMEGSMQVFPNPLPSNSNLTIHFNPNGRRLMPYADQRTQLSLYSLDGRLIHKEDLPPQGSSDDFIHPLAQPHALSPGYYILHWSVGGTWLDAEQVVVE